MDNPELIGRAAARVGSQSVVVVLDVKKTVCSARLEVCRHHNGNQAHRARACGLARRSWSSSAPARSSSIVDRDGEMKGYDLELRRRCAQRRPRPLTVLGGAGSLEDIGELVRAFGIIGAAAGSLFVFKGVYRAVLINYPRRAAEKDALLRAAATGRSVMNRFCRTSRPAPPRSPTCLCPASGAARC